MIFYIFAGDMVAESGFLIEPSLDGIPTGLELLHRSINGFSEIYRAEKFGQFVVLKALKPQYREDPVYEALLRKEFEIGYGLNDPHICRSWHFRRLTELGNCIEMEWVDGVSLAERFAEEKPSEALLRKIAAELCDAVAYLHARQVIHRDIKPSNILITHRGDNVKLIDFGLADADDSAILKMPAGTQRYLAPEVLAGRDADMRTDILAVGRVLSELTARSRGPHARALRKACRENPDERYQHITELKQAFLRPSRLPWLYVAVSFLVLFAGILAFMKSRPATTELPPLPAVDSVSVTTVTETPGDTVQATQIAAPQARSKKEATREDIDALFKEATDLFD